MMKYRCKLSSQSNQKVPKAKRYFKYVKVGMLKKKKEKKSTTTTYKAIARFSVFENDESRQRLYLVLVRNGWVLLSVNFDHLDFIIQSSANLIKDWNHELARAAPAGNRLCQLLFIFAIFFFLRFQLYASCTLEVVKTKVWKQRCRMKIHERSSPSNKFILRKLIIDY